MSRVRQGGTIVGSLNLPAQSFYYGLPTLYNLVVAAGVEKVLFYCGESIFQTWNEKVRVPKSMTEWRPSFQAHRGVEGRELRDGLLIMLKKEEGEYNLAYSKGESKDG